MLVVIIIVSLFSSSVVRTPREADRQPVRTLGGTSEPGRTVGPLRKGHWIGCQPSERSANRAPRRAWDWDGGWGRAGTWTGGKGTW